MFHFHKLWFCLCLIWMVSSKAVPVKNIGSRIVGGKEAALGQIPWEALLYAEKELTVQCSGAIIDREWILTSASCLDGATSVRVLTGIVDSEDDGATVSTSAEIVLHEMYDPGTISNDIGLVRLEEPLDFDENTRDILLAEEPVRPDEEVVASGWGTTSEESIVPSPTLQYTYLVTVDRRECDQIFGEGNLADEVLCARSPREEEPRSPCAGDSGSPLVSNFNTDPRLVGIFVFITDAGCEAAFPSGYMGIEFYTEWIDQHVRPPPK